MAELYDHPEIYDERWSERSAEAYRRHYRAALEGARMQSILDCSIGTGNPTYCLADLGYDICGSDLSETMLRQAEANARARNVRCHLTKCDFRRLTEHFDGRFDCVMSTGNALAHVDNADVRRTLCQMDALVRPGGYIYLDSRNWDLELKRRQRFHNFQLPYAKPDGEKVYYVQVWDFHADGTVTINILNAYEREGRIVRQDVWEEHLHPFPLALVQEQLTALGYRDIRVMNMPAFIERPLEETDWYCLLAHKA